MSDVHPAIAAMAKRTRLPVGAVGLVALAQPTGEVDAHQKDWPNAEALVARGWATLEPVGRSGRWMRLRMTPAGRAATDIMEQR